MPKVVIVTSSNNISRIRFGHLLESPDVKKQLPNHGQVKKKDVLITDHTSRVLGDIRVGYLEVGLLLRRGADPASTFAIVQEEVLEGVPRPFNTPEDVAERIFVVSQTGKVVRLVDSDEHIKKEAA